MASKSKVVSFGTLNTVALPPAATDSTPDRLPVEPEQTHAIEKVGANPSGPPVSVLDTVSAPSPPPEAGVTGTEGVVAEFAMATVAI